MLIKLSIKVIGYGDAQKQTLSKYVIITMYFRELALDITAYISESSATYGFILRRDFIKTY